MSEQEHLHLALFGYTRCRVPDCPLPVADPAEDLGRPLEPGPDGYFTVIRGRAETED